MAAAGTSGQQSGFFKFNWGQIFGPLTEFHRHFISPKGNCRHQELKTLVEGRHLLKTNHYSENHYLFPARNTNSPIVIQKRGA
jgi:hypothetical protein